MSVPTDAPEKRLRGEALRNPKRERFARAIVFDGKHPAEAYVDAGFTKNRANHWKLLRHPLVKVRIAELTEEREMTPRAARTPVTEVLIEFEKHGVERLADFYHDGAAGALVVRDLRAVREDIALSLLNALHEGFGIAWDQSMTQPAAPAKLVTLIAHFE
jgi:hypothetical protein